MRNRNSSSEKGTDFVNTNGKNEELLADRIYILSEDIIYFKEVPDPSPLTAKIAVERLEKLAAELKSCALLVDLTNAKRPDARTRIEINKGFNRITKYLYHCSYFTGKNPIINTAIRFVIFGSGLQSYSVDNSREEALKKIRDARD